MDSTTKKHVKPSLEEHANILSKIFFCWILPFFYHGYKTDLAVHDLHNCAQNDLSGPLADKLEKHWDMEMERALKHNTSPSLKRAIRKTFFKQYSVFGVMYFFQCIVVRLSQPIVLAIFISYFEQQQSVPDQAKLQYRWIFGSLIVAISFISIMIMHHGSVGCQRIGMRCRIACCSLIYRKLLKLDRPCMGPVDVGQLVNLMSNDVQRFDIASPFLHYIWIMPIQASVAAVIMFQSLSWGAVAGLSALTLQAVPLQGYLSKLQGRYRFKIAYKTDNRVKLMSEITSGIQVIKMYAWELPFANLVELARKIEINLVSKTSYIRGFSVALMVFTERLTTYLALITYVLLGNRLTGDVVFSMAQLFNTLQLYMSILFPLGLSTFSEAQTSIKRIEKFLSIPIQQEVKPVKTNEMSDSSIGWVQMDMANARWIANPITNTLTDVSLAIMPGSLCCVVGPVGAGKSSLLQVILRELPVLSGTLHVNGVVSFASQEPWLFVGSIRNNILFGMDFLKERYYDVVHACALQRDLQMFERRDRTLVGERGAALSGGQRARVNLARAVYREADIYLLDDPLSAVDAHVARHIFNKCISTYLAGKTRILVTHQLQFLEQADIVVVLNNGRIEFVGSFSDMPSHTLAELKHEFEHEEYESQEENLKLITNGGGNPLKRSQSFHSVHSENTEVAEKKMADEETERGSIPFRSYYQYFKAGGNICLLLFMLILFILAQCACNSTDLWLTYWTNAEKINETYELLEDPSVNSTNDTWPAVHIVYRPLSQNMYIYIYSALICASIILTTSRSLLFFKVCMRASKRLHHTMFLNVLRTTMHFFHTNPSGRILNRFSKDMGAIDELLPRAMIESFQIFFVMLGILGMVFLVSPYMCLPAAVLAAFFYWFRVVYLATAQDVKRLESITRAPVFSHVSASYHGIATVRAFKAQQRLITEFDTLQNTHTSAWFMFIACSEAFGFYLDVISTIFLVIVTFQFILLDDGSTLGGNVGLVISQSLILTGMLQYGVRQTTEVASNMTSVERVLQYTRLEQERSPDGKKIDHIRHAWPQSGRISFKKVSLRYEGESQFVLNELSIEIQSGEKIGIVGRTGAGKSSLIAALFRLAPIEGLIEIDGIDTALLPLDILRSHISIIPQEPVLFSASIRYNLDPFGACEDPVLWQALEKVELKGMIETLDQQVDGGGTNFSAGQRQLICMARAIVRNNKILVLDEATANVDPKTDSLIQSSIRRHFGDCTVLTIAHRLNTIMDSDKVLVLDAGRILEFAHAHQLLQQHDGHFASMVRQTGTATSAALRHVAHQDYQQKMAATSAATAEQTRL